MFARTRTVPVIPTIPLHASPEAIRPRGEPELDFEDTHLRSFIQHSRRFPVRIKKLGWLKRRALREMTDCETGLIVRSSAYIKPGTMLEVNIRTRHGEQCFTCKVVLVRELSEGFELGLWFLLKADGQRIRMVEQVCRIELCLRDRKHQDGPFVSNEVLEQEWVGKFASRFPNSFNRKEKTV